MVFWLAFIGLNFLFFTIPYLLNFKNEPNPFSFLSGNFSVRKLIVFIIQKPSSDPWRIYFEYSLFILFCVFFSWKAPFLSYIGSLIASFGFVVIAYSGVMLYVFNNVPVIKSDLEFAKTGVSILYKKKILSIHCFNPIPSSHFLFFPLDYRLPDKPLFSPIKNHYSYSSNRHNFAWN